MSRASILTLGFIFITLFGILKGTAFGGWGIYKGCEVTQTGKSAFEKHNPEPWINENETFNINTDSFNYRNRRQGFEVVFPSIGRWKPTIKIDEACGPGCVARFDAVFETPEGEDYVAFVIRKNLFSESSPLVPQWPFCQKEEHTLFHGDKISAKLYSTYDTKKGTVKEECDSSLEKFFLDDHSVETRFCLNRVLGTYAPELKKNEEFSYYCKGGDDLYYFALYCKGMKWEGKKGRSGCYDLFTNILSSMKFYH